MREEKDKKPSNPLSNIREELEPVDQLLDEDLSLSILLDNDADSSSIFTSLDDKAALELQAYNAPLPVDLDSQLELFDSLNNSISSQDQDSLSNPRITNSVGYDASFEEIQIVEEIEQEGIEEETLQENSELEEKKGPGSEPINLNPPDETPLFPSARGETFNYESFDDEGENKASGEEEEEEEEDGSAEDSKAEIASPAQEMENSFYKYYRASDHKLSEELKSFVIPKTDNGDELQLHKIFNGLGISLREKEPLFISEQNFKNACLLVEKLNLGKKDQDGSTSLLLLTKLLHAHPPALHVGSEPNYAFHLFWWLVIQDFDHSLANFTHSRYFFRMNEQENPSRHLEDFRKLCESYLFIKKVFRSYLTGDACSSFKKYYNNVRIYSNELHDLTRSLKEWESRRPSDQKRVMFLLLLNDLICRIDLIFKRLIKLIKTPHFLFTRESQNMGISFPSSILTHENSKLESPLYILFREDGLPLIYNMDFIRACKSLFHMYLEKIALILHEKAVKEKNIKKCYQIFSSWIEFIPSKISKSISNQDDNPGEFRGIILDTLVYKTVRLTGKVEDLRFALEELISDPGDNDFKNFFTTNSEEDEVSVSCAIIDSIENEFLECFLCLLDIMKKYDRQLSRDHLYKSLMTSIVSENLEIFYSLLLDAKENNRHFESIKSFILPLETRESHNNRHYESIKYFIIPPQGLTLLDLAQQNLYWYPQSRIKNKKIVDALVEEGFRSTEEGKASLSRLIDKKSVPPESTDQEMELDFFSKDNPSSSQVPVSSEHVEQASVQSEAKNRTKKRKSPASSSFEPLSYFFEGIKKGGELSKQVIEEKEGSNKRQRIGNG